MRALQAASASLCSQATRRGTLRSHLQAGIIIRIPPLGAMRQVGGAKVSTGRRAKSHAYHWAARRHDRKQQYRLKSVLALSRKIWSYLLSLPLMAQPACSIAMPNVAAMPMSQPMWPAANITASGDPTAAAETVVVVVEKVDKQHHQQGTHKIGEPASSTSSNILAAIETKT